jgi:APA family basic amino acid/polyamine antiporter
MLHRLIRRKPISSYQNTELNRTLTAFDLTLMGIGAIIGAGVFVLTGIVAATQAGPAVVLSYLLSGIACMFAALAYAELASCIGGSGSAYSYAYAGFGELIAWIIGWNLILEYSMSVVTVAIGWAGYVSNLFEAMNIHLPFALTHSYFEGGVINLLASAIIIAVAAILCIGVKHGARFNAVIVFIKLITIALFLFVAIPNIHPENWHPFLPFGTIGVVNGAALVFFAYIGFDALSTAVEESIDPQRNVPIGIISSLLICSLIYILVSGALTGIVPYTTLNVGSPVAAALLTIGYKTVAGLIAAGAIAGLTTVILVMFYGLTRICMTIARDGLIPTEFASIHPQTKTPVRVIISTAIVMAMLAGLAPIHRAAEMVNIGTLTAFAFVCLGVVVFRITHPELKRGFKLPFNPLIPALGVLSCVYLMLHLSDVTWTRFFIWSLIGVVIYFIYGLYNSRLQRESATGRP